jgi:integrase
MALLHAGVDTSTIALWLGHASTKATDVYMHDLAIKEKALARTAPPNASIRRYVRARLPSFESKHGRADHDH